jgi:hypothetical protein
MDVVPGQWWQRVLAVLLLATGVWLDLQQDVLGTPHWVLLLIGILAFMFSVLAVPSLYDKWMLFAVWLSVWATRVIFSIVYVVVVPFTWLFYVLSGRTRAPGPTDSLWIPKRRHDRSVDELERMG